MSSSSSSSLSSLSTVPSPQASSPPQSTALLASSAESPEELISTINTISSQASSHLRASEQAEDYYDSALALMQVLQTINSIVDRVLPHQHDLFLTYGKFGGRKFVNVLAAEMFSINIQLCVAFSELGMWALVGSRVSVALELAGMAEGRFHVSEEARVWLTEMGETAKEQVAIDRGVVPAVDA